MDTLTRRQLCHFSFYLPFQGEGVSSLRKEYASIDPVFQDLDHQREANRKSQK